LFSASRIVVLPNERREARGAVRGVHCGTAEDLDRRHSDDGFLADQAARPASFISSIIRVRNGVIVCYFVINP
jgi:hypothetical protein